MASPKKPAKSAKRRRRTPAAKKSGSTRAARAVKQAPERRDAARTNQKPSDRHAPPPTWSLTDVSARIGIAGVVFTTIYTIFNAPAKKNLDPDEAQLLWTVIAVSLGIAAFSPHLVALLGPIKLPNWLVYRRVHTAIVLSCMVVFSVKMPATTLKPPPITPLESRVSAQKRGHPARHDVELAVEAPPVSVAHELSEQSRVRVSKASEPWTSRKHAERADATIPIRLSDVTGGRRGISEIDLRDFGSEATPHGLYELEAEVTDHDGRITRIESVFANDFHAVLTDPQWMPWVVTDDDVWDRTTRSLSGDTRARGTRSTISTQQQFLSAPDFTVRSEFMLHDGADNGLPPAIDVQLGNLVQIRIGEHKIDNIQVIPRPLDDGAAQRWPIEEMPAGTLEYGRDFAFELSIVERHDSCEFIVRIDGKQVAIANLLMSKLDFTKPWRARLRVWQGLFKIYSFGIHWGDVTRG